MKRTAILSIFCLWPVAALAADYASTYSKFDISTCEQIEKGDEYVYAGTWACEGYEGLEIIQSSADDRSFAAFGSRNDQHCALHKTFSPFNTALSPVEWRLKDGKPIAAIERWSVVSDDKGNSVTWLVVNALRPHDSCHVHYVAGSYPEANAAARRAADDLTEGFDCENGVPTVDSTVGAPPIELSACKDLARE